MIKANIQTVPDGYVVMVTIYDANGNRDTMPTRCFGEYKSAAIEFRNFINDNNIEPDKFERQIKLWAKSYDPAVKYSYPEINDNKTRITLRKQKGESE